MFRSWLSNLAARLIGTTTNDNAPAGIVGEFITQTVASGSAVALTTVTTANITSISLTAGDWDLAGFVDYTFTGATSTLLQAALSLTSATLPTQAGGGGLGTDPLAIDSHSTPATFTGTHQQDVGPVRVSIAATTTVFLVAQTTFSAGTMAAYGTIRARRVR